MSGYALHPEEFIDIAARESAMSTKTFLIGSVRVPPSIAEVRDPRARRIIQGLIDGAVQFYQEDPSRLASSFDLAFFAEILKDQIYRETILHRAFHGCLGEWWELTPIKDVDPATDVTKRGIRGRQAHNYALDRTKPAIKDALLVLTTSAFLKQSSSAARSSDLGMVAITAMYPEQPFDYLFMVMAVDRALQPGQPARVALEA